MSRIVLLVAVIVFTIAALVLCRVQPSATATIFRRDGHIAVRKTPLYMRVIGAAACHAPLISDGVAFDAEVPAASAKDDELTIRIRFTYAPPPTLPRGWPAGDWCTSLATRVSDVAARSTRAHDVADFLDRHRQTSEAISALVERQLRTDGVIVSPVSARIDLPAGF